MGFEWIGGVDSESSFSNLKEITPKLALTPEEINNRKEEAEIERKAEEGMVVGKTWESLISLKEQLDEINSFKKDAALINEVVKGLWESSTIKDCLIWVSAIWNYLENKEVAKLFKDSSAMDNDKISQLTQKLYSLGFLLNWTIQLWGPLLVEVKWEIGIDKTWIEALFPKEYLEKHWRITIVDNPDFMPSGYEIWGVELLNVVRVSESFQTIKTDIDSETFQKYTLHEALSSMANNEKAHKILRERYGFDNSFNYDWSNVSSWVDWYEIQNSRQVNEFLSDVASINTSGVDLRRILNNCWVFYQLYLKDWWGLDMEMYTIEGSGKYIAKWYDYSNRYIISILNNLISQKNIDIKTIWMQVESQEEFLFKIAATLDEEDINYIKQEMLKQWKYLLSIIEEANK